MTTEDQRSWERIEDLLEGSDPQEVENFLDSLNPGEVARAVSRLDSEEKNRLLATLSPEGAASLIHAVPDGDAVDLIESLEPAAAATILEQMQSDAQAGVIRELAAPEPILTAMDPHDARIARGLSQYPRTVVGGWMLAEYLCYPGTITVADLLEDLRTHAEKYRDYDVQYAYVTDEEGRLTGVMRLRDLVLAPGTREIREIMLREPLVVRDDTAIQEVHETFEQTRYYGLPVVDAAGVLVGVLQRAALDHALSELSATDLRRAKGVVWEELRTMPLVVRSRRRLAWLSVNIVLNVMAASVIAFYQETLTSVIALAVFLPIISDMSGCSGNQAVAVSMRELTLGLIRPADALRVWLKELGVGLLNGLSLGLLAAGLAWLWKGNPFLGLVVGAAMTLNTMVAVSIGGLVPLLLRRLRIDPALASGPILTTITDMCGFFFVLSLASAMMPLLKSA